MLYTHRPYWKHHAVRCVLSLTALLTAATQTTHAQTQQDTIAPDQAWLSAYQETQSPTQAPSATGSRHHPSPHGPFSQTPNQGIPEKAYTPFDQAAIECPAGECQFKDNIILVKLKPETDHSAKMGQDTSTAKKGRSATEEQLARLLSDLPIAQIEPVFQNDPKQSRSVLIETPEGDLIPRPDLSRWHRIELDSKAARAWARTTDDPSVSDQNNDNGDQTLQTVLQELRRRPEVEYAEPDYIYKVNGTPVATDFYADPDLSQQWHLDAAGIPEAWGFLDTEGLNSGGNPDIVVAVIDTGVDYTHPDLINSMWVNSGEFNTASNQDNDGNGYRDDIHGARVIGNSLSGDPMDDHGHGTHVAGIIAAHGNNGQGGVGVAPNVKIMAIKAAQYSGILSSTDAARGIEYAMDNGADIINMSFGSYARSQLMEDALANAFGTAVLVAAAGNDGMANLSCSSLYYPRRGNMYPAALNWVIGVMAQNQTADANGDRLTGFSNFDCSEFDSSEYEVMAPGEGIYSTLPFGGYGAWSGTSMATPIVAGVAALARTYWSDKSTYSSRFIMGQLSATGPKLQAHTNPIGVITQWTSTDAHSNLTTVPTPSLKYLEHWTFDTTSIDADNNPNGRIESGETIDLALVIRNHWGKADNVSVTLEAKAPSALAPDPYVTMITDTVNYGAVSSFSNDDNGLVRNGDGLVVGVDNPFRFSISDSAPNNHLIVFQVTITADNGFDANAPGTTHQSVFYAMVQRGKMLDSVISQDMTLTKDQFWIVPGPVLIPAGVTVNVDPGTQIQWGGVIDDSPYAEPQVPYIDVEGSLLMNGTEAEPIELFGHAFSSNRTQIISSGTTELRYCLVEDPRFGLRHDKFGSSNHRPIDVIDHCRMYSSGLRGGLTIIADNTSKSIFKLRNLQRENNSPVSIYGNRWPQIFYHQSLSESWVDIDGGLGIDFYRNRDLKNNVITPNDPGQTNGFVSVYAQSDKKSDSGAAAAHEGVRFNAFLNRSYAANLGEFRRYYADFSRGHYFGLTDNFWDMPSDALIDVIISDSADDFNRGILEYSPVTSTPHTTTYPYVTNIDVKVNGVTTTEVGAETMDITVTFNRDMDTSIDPMVSFGPAEPYTDFLISGAWVDARNWQGSFNVNPITGDGFQYFRVINAVAADDAWLKSGNDYYRFRFEIITSGTSAMSMQASGGEGQVSLWWSQDDFDTLAGFNLYRAPLGSSSFQRVNTTLIPQGMTTWTDNTVTPGQPYQYYFKVVKTDLSESEASNIAQATALDTISPTLSHTPITGAAAGQPLTFRATVSDNVSVQSVTLFHRAIGQSTWQQSAMSLISNRYAATLDGSTINAPGLEYYIEASDGVNVTRSTLPATPHSVVVDDRPVVTAISPTSGPAAGGTAVTITGSNFDAGASVMVGQSVCANVTVTSTTSIQCTTNQHIPEVVDVRVTNPSSAPGLLVGGFRYLSDTATLSLPSIVAGRGQTIEVPVSLNNSQGMVSAQFTISFDSSVVKVSSTALGNLTSGWTQAVNTSQAGAITVSMATGGGGVSADGSVLRISFEAHGQPGATTALTLSNVAINDGSIPVQVGNGQIEIDSVHQIQGQVSYWNGSRPVNATSMVLTSEQSPINGAVADSASNGAFSVFAPSGTHLLIPRRSSAEGGISALDASLALRHASGESSLTGHALTAADVNRSGAVTAHDAFLILQHVVGLSNLPFTGAGQVWVFDPEQRSFSNLASPKANQHFTGILLGDPSGNWGEQAPAAVAARTLSQPRFSLSSGWADQGGVVTTTLSVGSSSPFYALEFDLSFDPSVVEVVSVTPSAGMAGWSALSNTQQAGKLRVASAGSQAVSGPGDLVSIQFKMLGTSGSQSSLAVTALKIDESSVSGLPSNASLFSGEPRPIFKDQFMK